MNFSDLNFRLWTQNNYKPESRNKIFKVWCLV